MSNFDEWFNSYHSNNESYAEQLTKDAFEAGAASRQAEIDALKQEVTREREQATEYFVDCENIKAERDKLQKEISEAVDTILRSQEKQGLLENRINEALTWLTRTDMRAINHAREILKGEEK